MSDETRTPDALYVPHMEGANAWIRAEKVTTLARKLLNMPDGPPPYIEYDQSQTDGVATHFVRKRLDDSKLFPKNHPRSGEVRHEWVDGPDGVKLGYSKAD